MAIAKSKYARVLPGLEKLQTTTEPYQQRIDRVKETWKDSTILEVADAYVDLRGEKKALEEELKGLELQIEAATQILVNNQDAGGEDWGRYGVSSNALRLPTGETLRVQSEPYGHVVDKEAFRGWCIANGYEQQLQLWPGTMNLVTKERLLAGDNPPDGVAVFRKDSLRLVTAGQKEEDE